MGPAAAVDAGSVDDAVGCYPEIESRSISATRRQEAMSKSQTGIYVAGFKRPVSTRIAVGDVILPNRPCIQCDECGNGR